MEDGKDENDKGFWTEIGAAWPHRDGKGYSVRLKGNLVMREIPQEPVPKDAPTEASAKDAPVPDPF